MSVSNRLVRVQQRKAELDLAEILERPEGAFTIHYAAEDLGAGSTGSSSRIVCVAVHSIGQRQTRVFSVVEMAEKEGIAPDKILANYALLERKVLAAFFEYVREHQHHSWVHWNMRDTVYGFDALVLRGEVLGVPTIEVPLHRRVDLARILRHRYGKGYAGKPRLYVLAEKNGVGSSEIMRGAAESEAFALGKFPAIRDSAARKAVLLAELAELAGTDQLETDASWWSRHGRSWASVIDAATSHWAFRLAGAVALAAALVQALLRFWPE